jgi:hypothetical protein
MMDLNALRAAINIPQSAVVQRAARALLPLALMTAGAMALAVALGLFVRGPAQDQLAAAQASYEAGRQAQTRLQTARQTQIDLGNVWKGLPERTDFASLILAISELAKRDRVAIPGMTYSFQKIEEGRAVKAAIVFNAAGEYAAIRRFIHRLETAGPYLTIESLDAARARGADVAFNVKIVTYLKPQPPSLKGGA